MEMYDIYILILQQFMVVKNLNFDMYMHNWKVYFLKSGGNLFVV